jgi:hypothetical protein
MGNIYCVIYKEKLFGALIDVGFVKLRNCPRGQ